MRKIIMAIIFSIVVLNISACTSVIEHHYSTSNDDMSFSIDDSLACVIDELESDAIHSVQNSYENGETCIYGEIILFDSSPHFRIFQSPDSEPWYISYEIINTDGCIVKSFVTDRAAWIAHINDNTLIITRSIGLAVPSVVETLFYSIKDDMFSDVFYSADFYVIKDNIIAYVQSHYAGSYTLTVRDIFDSDLLYHVVSLDGFTINKCFISAINDIYYSGDGNIAIAYVERIDGEFINNHKIISIW